MKKIEKIREHLLSKNDWISHYFDEVLFPNGNRGHYNRIVERDGIPGTVVIPINEEGYLGMIYLYRYPVQEWLWEFPKGFGEPGLSGAENARKELLEETGFEASNISFLGNFFANTGLMSTSVEVFAASQLHQSMQETERDEGSITQFRFFSKEDIKEMIQEKQLKDGISLAAYSLLIHNSL